MEKRSPSYIHQKIQEQFKYLSPLLDSELFKERDRPISICAAAPMTRTVCRYSTEDAKKQDERNRKHKPASTSQTEGRKSQNQKSLAQKVCGKFKRENMT